MVGVPHSLSCDNCKRRKKGCDHHRPSCGRCVESNLECLYSSKSWKFVPQSRPSPLKPSITPLPPRRETESLGRVAEEKQVFGSFWNLYFRGSNVGQVTNYDESSGYLYKIWELTSDDPPVQLAFSACVSQFLGGIYQDRTLAERGYSKYSQSLRGINLSLNNTDRSLADRTFACCRLACLYEMMQNTLTNGTSRVQTFNYQKHVQGMVQLARLRGHQRNNRNALAKTLLRELRFLAAGTMVRNRTSFSFDNDDAIHLSIDHTWNPIDDLLDITLALPCVLRRHDAILRQTHLISDDTNQADVLKEAQELLIDCIAYSSLLVSWEIRAVEWYTQPADVESGQTSLFELATDSGSSALMIANYFWATCVLLYQQCRCTFARLSLSFPDDLPPLSATMEPATHATSIAESVSMLFDTSNGFWGAEKSLFSIVSQSYYTAARAKKQGIEVDLLAKFCAENEYAPILTPFLKSFVAISTITNIQEDIFAADERRRMARVWYGVRSETL